MNEHDFIYKLINDKAFMKQVAENTWDIEDNDQNDEQAMGKLFKIAADRMGYDLDEAILQQEGEAQIKAMGGFKAVRFVIALGRAQKKAKKAHR